MRITGDLSHARAAPEAVLAMLLDPAFQERKCRASGALRSSVEVDPAARRVTTVRRMPTTDAAALLRRRAPDGVDIRETVCWGRPDSRGGCRAVLDVAFVGQPLRMTGSIAIEPLPSGSSGFLDAELTARVPVLGGRIERLVEPLIRRAVAAEKSVGTCWLDELCACGDGRPSRRGLR